MQHEQSLVVACRGLFPDQWLNPGKRAAFIPIPKNGSDKECSNYHPISLISHSSKVVLKILQARLQQYMNQELSDVQAGFRKGRRTRGQITNIRWITEKAREFQKNIYFCFKTDPSLYGKWKGKKRKKWQILFSWVPKALCTVTAAMTLKD